MSKNNGNKKKTVKHEKAGAKMEKKLKEAGVTSAWKKAKKSAMKKAYNLSKSAREYGKAIKKQRRKYE